MTIHRRYSWTYKGANAGFEIDWPDEWWHALRAARHDLEIKDYAWFVHNDPYEGYLRELIDWIVQSGRERFDLSEGRDALRYALAFVQHLTYYREKSEWPRYPMETIIDGGGDCEDSAILAAFVARHLGYSCALLYFVKSELLGLRHSGHMDVGIQPSYEGEFSGTYWLNGAGDKYYYLSANGANWQIGQFTKQFGDSAHVYPV